MSAIHQSNARTWAAICAVRVLGRNPSTMSEVRDSLNSRRRSRGVRLTPEERRELDIAFYRREAPDMLQKLRLI